MIARASAEEYDPPPVRDSRHLTRRARSTHDSGAVLMLGRRPRQPARIMMRHMPGRVEERMVWWEERDGPSLRVCSRAETQPRANIARIPVANSTGVSTTSPSQCRCCRARGLYLHNYDSRDFQSNCRLWARSGCRITACSGVLQHQVLVPAVQDIKPEDSSRYLWLRLRQHCCIQT